MHCTPSCHFPCPAQSYAFYCSVHRPAYLLSYALTCLNLYCVVLSVSVEPAAGEQILDLHKELVCAVGKNSDAISDMQRKLDVLIQKSQSNGQRSGQENGKLQTKVADTLFRACRSISTLRAAADGHLVSLPESNMLYCNLCVPPVERAPKRAAGTLKYDFSCGVNLPVRKKMHQQFKSLKSQCLRISSPRAISRKHVR